ncbi:DNA-directed RNA polymerase subunit alpha [Patescibacteria group bacterium]|nr:DNA-directed RNA polymerase subunit alpha [Patescibacteria group bacterium]
MNITLPTKLEIKEAKDNRAEVIIEPCYPGYGVTLGNALRRVLLSSLEGAAITSYKIIGAMHEFATLPNVKEDLVELMLNLKNIRLKCHSDEPVILNLKVKGEKTVTAGDIEKNADVEVINTSQPILTLTDKSAEIDMELTVKKGRGYLTVEDRSKEKVELGVIMIDALFSPVINVGFEVEHVRVGDRTDYDKIILKLETDGSFAPQEALEKSAEILVEHFNFICHKQEIPSAAAEPQEVKAEAKEEVEELKSEKKESKKKEEKIAEESIEKPKRKRGRPKKVE